MKLWQVVLAVPVVVTISVIASSPKVCAELVNKATTSIQVQTGDWTTVDGALTILTQTLESSPADSLASNLYSQMSSDFKDTFSWENFQKAIDDTQIKVISAEILNEGDEYAKVKMRLKSQSQEKDFFVYLKKENGSWKLYATEGI